MCLGMVGTVVGEKLDIKERVINYDYSLLECQKGVDVLPYRTYRVSKLHHS